jgi:hypothetical protein
LTGQSSSVAVNVRIWLIFAAILTLTPAQLAFAQEMGGMEMNQT